MERQLDIQLEKLKKRLFKMCSLVDEQVNDAIKAVEEENIELAKTVIEKDDRVDKFDIKIEKTCQKIFALNQPVAMDLRLIMSAMSLDMNLERIGDNAVNIAEYIIEMKKKPDFFTQTKFEDMAKLVRVMIKTAIDSFVDNNAEYARKVIELENELDLLDKENRNIIVEIMKKDCKYVEEGVAMLGISRMMERLGDLATNIAEDVYFIVEAHLIKHRYEKYLFHDEEDEEDETSPD
ncbi:MAG: phosphate signaling complex protein PhoU [Ignavibacteriaceae bacterium]